MILRSSYSNNVMYDRVLLCLILGLISIGFIMVTSASIPIGQKIANDPFFFSKRDGLHILISLFISIIILCFPITFWKNYSNIMLIISIIMLLTVPIIGNSINGASRWIYLGNFCIQPAEFAKLSLFCYLSKYLVVYGIRNNLCNFLKPVGVVLLISILLLAQPDFGTLVVIFFTTLSMLFLAGAKFWHFVIIIYIVLSIIGFLIIIEPYRIHRIIYFWNPWKDPFDKGYQLTQSLIAFGRGEVWGQGLGNSIQKLEYLPEAHTDFIFSIIGEELGYIGVILIILIIFLISFRAMSIGFYAISIGQKTSETNYLFSGFFAYSIGIWFSFQSLINIGVTLGILPTKGLTLPLISYGGSSLLIMSIALTILLRIDHEIRLKKIQAFYKIF